MDKNEIKIYLVIVFVVVELLSMLFNIYFVKINIAGFGCNLNFSVFFFCLGFFIVDVVADKYSATEAKKFVFYKLFSQVLFLILGNLAINVYALEGTQLATALNKSLWMIMAGFLSSYIGYYAMSTIMNYMKIAAYQGGSIFKRYLYSTIPAELLFSFTFTFLCFYKETSFEETMHVFVVSALVKIALSVLFAVVMSFIVRVSFSKETIKKTLIKTQVN